MSTSRAVRAVLFDLDGTLLDTAPDMIGALNALRTEEGLTDVAYTEARELVSHGALGLVRCGFPAATDGEFEKLRARFLELYRTRLADETTLFPGGESLLDHLEANAMPWGIVTNKPSWLAEPLLDTLGLMARAQCLVCGDTLPERKPHPRPLLHAAELLAVCPTECVYVGDALRDVEAARAAGMRPVVASFGYVGDSAQCNLWPAEAWIAAPVDLIGWLAST